MTLKRQKKRKLHHDVEASKDMSPCSSKVLRNNGDDMFVEADYVVSTPTRLEFIKQISIGLQQRQMVLVEGPIGCGKTTLVREIARARNLPLHIYQMGEQLDAKSLFGSFQCGEVPGDFTWKSSEFSKFLHERCMLLLEDIDTASPELISNLIDLCENRQIDLPVGGTIRLHDEVCIIVTIRTTGDSHSFWSSDRGAFLNKLPFHIKLPLFPDDELQQIIRMKYSRIAAFASTLISLFNNVCVRNSSTQKSSRRPLTNTDLFRACSRLNDLPDTSNSLAILTELIDVWAMHSLSAEDVFELSRIIADQLSINSDALEYHLSVRHPLISIQLDELSFGRAKLRRNKSALSNKNQLYPLGKTRDVCQMLERISICIERKEPVLLVGETGVGKTTLVQYICHHMNVVLHVVNFSQHTDATDLIGGYVCMDYITNSISYLCMFLGE
ncbi:hypothetical protein AB6A40_004927 [Gnathostoma spinigerum]|uniref:Midasin n=1 Tax=Gnathostoma spinigerum TaxID=75299 RepID=A0ABD6EDY9_9BILA